MQFQTPLFNLLLRICSAKLRKTEKRKSGIAKLSLRMIAESIIFLRNESKNLRFLSQKCKPYLKGVLQR